MNTCLIFSFHSPLQLTEYSFFEIGKNQPYFDSKLTLQRFKSNYKSIFKPALEGIFTLLERKDFRCSLQFSGTFIEALQQTDSSLIGAIKHWLQSGKITLIGSTYHESIAALISPSLFHEQVAAHKLLLKKVFNTDPLVFINTENIHFNSLLSTIEDNNYQGLITEPLTWYLQGQSPSNLFSAPKSKLSIMLNQTGHLTTDGAADKGIVVKQINPMIATYDNWKQYIMAILETYSDYATADQLLNITKAPNPYSIPMPIGTKRDHRSISTFTANGMQKEVVTKIKDLEEKAVSKNDTNLLYQLSMFTAGDYFLDLNHSTITSPEKQPYDYYISLMNMLSDFEINKLT